MSYLAHNCRNCDHPQHHHSAATQAQRAADPLLDFAEGGQVGNPRMSCGCCASRGHAWRDFDPTPTVYPSWRLPDHELEPLARPGTVHNEGNSHRRQLCGCDECHAAYAKATA